MKRLVFGVLVLICGAFGYTPVQAATTNSFTISSYAADISLSRDNENRSVATVTETITAEFPSYDQNHGLERAFVKDYDGHSLSFVLKNVTDAGGNTLDWRWNGNSLRIGDADTYVHGTHTYVISYTMRDVTRYYHDTGRDELYWDVIGTDWQVPIAQAIVDVRIDSSLQSELTGDTACYRGSYGSTSTCQLEKTTDGFSVWASSLQPGEGVTVAVGFRPETFAAYEQSFMEKLFAWWVIVQFIAGPLAVVMFTWFIVSWSGRLNRKKELGTIVPEYLPPSDASVTVAARVGGYGTSIMTAQMLDFAVRHYLKIYEVKAKTLFSPAQYEIEIVQGVATLQPEEQEILKDTFGSLPSIGSRLNLKSLQNNPSYYHRTLNNDADLDKLIRGEYGFRALDEATKRWARHTALVALIVGIVTISFMWLLMASIVFGMSFVPYRLTDKGLVLRRYLEGLKMYIGVAEEERIKMLQSPSGAEKVASVADGTDDAQLIKLYEKVLPYAVLFGQEKEWNKQLGHYYETTQASPGWYAGQNAGFNAVVFSSAMSSFSQANTYTSSSSSSSGGSSGGGFSGGGGGGGGGGGW